MKDLCISSRSLHREYKMRDFFILILCYSIFDKRYNDTNEIVLIRQPLADYFKCSIKTISNWTNKLRELGFLSYAKRSDAGKTGYYNSIDKDTKEIIKNEYIIPKYKKIRVGNKNEIKFVNVYNIDQTELNEYLKETVWIDVLSDVEQYKTIFNDYIEFLNNRSNELALLEKSSLEINSTDKETNSSCKTIDKSSRISKKHKKIIKKKEKLDRKIKENIYYIEKKSLLDKLLPEFTCRYLKEGSLRLTHDICNTINPIHTDKIDETKYWKNSHIRNDMLSRILNTTDFTEKDVNGSIYRLTYNLYHDLPLDINTDIYNLIWNNAFNHIELSEQNRNKFKKLLMPLYMKEYLTGYKICNYKFIEKYYYGRSRYNRLSKDDKEQFELYRTFVNLTKCPISTFLDKIKKSLHKTLNTNKFIGADIFIHESNLHILMREKFLNRSIKCVNIYDGFYFENNIITDIDFYTVYNESILELKENLAKGIGSTISSYS